MSKRKGNQFLLEVSHNMDWWDDDMPTVVKVTINDEQLARMRHLAAVVAVEKAYKIELFDYSAEWIAGVSLDEYGDDLELLEGAKTTDVASIDCECLNVSSDSFKWTAYLKHTSVELKTEYIWLAEMDQEDT